MFFEVSLKDLPPYLAGLFSKRKRTKMDKDFVPKRDLEE